MEKIIFSEITFHLGSWRIWETVPSFWISFCGNKLARLGSSSFKRANSRVSLFAFKTIWNPNNFRLDGWTYLEFLLPELTSNSIVTETWILEREVNEEIIQNHSYPWRGRSRRLATQHGAMDNMGTLQNSDFPIYPLYFFLLHMLQRWMKTRHREINTPISLSSQLSAGKVTEQVSRIIPNTNGSYHKYP